MKIHFYHPKKVDMLLNCSPNEGITKENWKKLKRVTPYYFS